MPTRNWRDYMVQRLKEHPEDIPGYLSACLAEDGATFLTGLRTVVQARFGGAQDRPAPRVDPEHADGTRQPALG